MMGSGVQDNSVVKKDLPENRKTLNIDKREMKEIKTEHAYIGQSTAEITTNVSAFTGEESVHDTDYS